MADYLSGSIHFTGLGNGTDFDTMISQLKEIEMMPAKRLLKWKADWQKRVDAFQEVRAKLVDLKTAAEKMNSVEKFLVKTAESSVSSVASAVAKSNAQAGTYRIEVDQVATNSYWSMSTGFTDANVVINSSGQTKNFSYQYKGKSYDVSVPNGTTLKSLENLINNDTKNPGVKVSLINAAGGYTFQMRGMDTGTDNALYITQADFNGFTTGGAAYAPYTAQHNTSLTSPTAVINTSGAFTYQYTYNGQTRSLNMAAGATLEDLKNAINSDSGNPGVTADLALNGTTYSLTLEGDPALGGSPITSVADTTLTPGLGALVSTYTPSGDPGGGWHVQQSQNARFRINGWPVDYMETSSNTISDMAEGMTFTLKNEGSTVITVATDKEKVKENVLSFIEAINSVRSTILELTKYDEAKTTYSQEVATSLYEMQKGSILTGNYGVQLLSSQLKQATAGTPKGFTPLVENILGDGSSFWTGDIFSSLSQLGIKTMAEGQSGSANFGLLVLNTDPDLPTLDKVLDVNPEAVAEFFGATNQGKSDSPDFSFSSQVTSITKPGIYNVSYTVDSSGAVTGTINGKAAKYNAETGELGIVHQGPQSNSGAASATFLSDNSVNGDYTVNVANKAVATTVTLETGMASASTPLNTSGAAQTFAYTYNGTTHTVSLGNNENLKDLAARINFSKSNPGVKASVVEDSGTFNLVLTGATGLANTFGNAITTNISALSSKTQWDANQAGDDARYTITNNSTVPPQTTGTLTSASNTVTHSSAPGLVFTLQGAGTARITSQKYNDADGVYVRLDSLAQGTHSGNVRIKQGKVNELLSMLNGPAGKPEEGMLGKNGALGILDRNYKTIMDNIQKKVEREDARIVKWERLTRLRFARLEATLSTYDNLSKSTESQIKQLNSNSS